MQHTFLVTLALEDGETLKVAIVVSKLPPGKSNDQVLFGELFKVSQKKKGI